ncbi:hypothetical protein E2562_017783 [Oryza meyeriana var. granulata]|uniref:Uncharacterized protein n=1 Tax=Oryza meyeriana var. granulata TaxID=110450 RepID=A0A6G1BM01_9ORYZ|nr:hypothetical protein E2562_017783 [Oryza meyeriana var. granulata]
MSVGVTIPPREILTPQHQTNPGGPDQVTRRPSGRENTYWTHLSVRYTWGPLGLRDPTPPDKTQRPHTQGSNPSLSLSSRRARTPKHAHARARAPPPPHPAPMSPPSGSRALVTERRLGVLLSHLRPCALPVARRGLDDLRVREAEAETGVAASPCAGDEKGEPSGGEHCVFCEIVKGNKPAYKLYEDDVCLCILDIKPLSTGCIQCARQQWKGSRAGYFSHSCSHHSP